MILINVEKDKNQILKEVVDLLDVVQGKFDEYKTEKFSSLEAAVIRYISSKPQDEKSESIRKVNQGLWVDTGANFIFDEDVYGIGKQENDKAVAAPKIDISQLYHKTSRAASGALDSGYAAFFAVEYREEWEKDKNSGPNNSINPRTPTSKNETLLDFYRRLSADSKLTFMGKEIEFELPDGVQVTSKSELTVETVVQLFKHVMAGGKNSIYEKAKAKAEAEVTAEKKKSEPAVAARGGRGGRARRSGSTAAPDPRYNIRKAPRDRWIRGYQNKLKSFYDENAATREIANTYNAKKLTDGRYGYRTHFVTIKAAEDIISQLDEFLKPKAAAKPAANERRIKQLSKLLETKLVGSELSLFNEQDTPAPDAEKRKKLQDLLAELQQIKGRLAAAHSQNSIPESDASVDGKDLARFNEILSMLSWDNKGEIDFNEVYKKMQPAVAATKEPATEREKVAQVARTIRGTCWFDFDPNTGGIRSGTPIEIWAAAGANFEEWYKQIVALFDYEGASPQFNYKSGAAAQGRLKGAPSKLNDNKTQSISLDCLSVFMTKIADNFRRNGGIATKLLLQAKETNDQAKIKKVSDGAKYFLKGDTYGGSVAHGLEQVLNKVIAIIPSFKEGQIQKALETLADDNASDEAKQAARETIARARRNEKAVATNAQKAQARATTKPATAAAAKPAAAKPAAAKPVPAGAGAKPATTTVDAVEAMVVANAIIKDANAMADKGQGEQAKKYVRGLVAGGATREDYLTKNRKVSPQLLDAALDYIKTDPAGKAQLGKAVFPNDQAAAPAAPLGSRNNPFPSLEDFTKFVKSTNRDLKKRANRSFFVKWRPGSLGKYMYNAQGRYIKAVPVPLADAAPQQESLKQKREKLLNEAIFKKLVR